VLHQYKHFSFAITDRKVVAVLPKHEKDQKGMNLVLYPRMPLPYHLVYLSTFRTYILVPSAHMA
jgi:hypothetical protein